MHGDLYAHNILIDEKDSCYLGDFGAASFYDVGNKDFEKIEVRAFGCLLEDLLKLCRDKNSRVYQNLDKLSKRCMTEYIDERPLFCEMLVLESKVYS
jgi:serine/threonine protein kinase